MACHENNSIYHLRPILSSSTVVRLQLSSLVPCKLFTSIHVTGINMTGTLWHNVTYMRQKKCSYTLEVGTDFWLVLLCEKPCLGLTWVRGQVCQQREKLSKVFRVTSGMIKVRTHRSSPSTAETIKSNKYYQCSSIRHTLAPKPKLLFL